jgi:hypothetical protein
MTAGLTVHRGWEQVWLYIEDECRCSQTCSHPLCTVKPALILYVKSHLLSSSVQSILLSSSMYSQTCSHPLCTVKPALILNVQSILLSSSMYSQSCSHPLCAVKPTLILYVVKPALILYVQSNLLSSSMYSQTCSHPLCTVKPGMRVGLTEHRGWEQDWLYIEDESRIDCT